MMKCHQVLTGACNAGDKCFAVGSVEGVPFTAYAAGCNIVILANTFERIQVIPGICHDNVQISCIDCSTDTGKVSAAYGKVVCVFEPTPLQAQNSSHHLDYRWIKTGVVEANSYINALSWNLEGNRLITAGDNIQMWAPAATESGEGGDRVSFDFEYDSGNEPDWQWICTWEAVTASPTILVEFSPDGTLFATSSSNDRLVKVWYDNKLILSPSKFQEGNPNELSRLSVSYGYIYLPHPSAVTGFAWRTTSKYMPKGSVSNMLVTSCRDNICRVWTETVLPDDGLVSLTHVDPIAAQNPRFRMHRHKHRFMQRLKHIKACFHLRHGSRMGPNGSCPGAGTSSNKTNEPIPSLPSNYSLHDFHIYGAHAAGVTPGFHFHLAATINAETDIPLVPSLSAVSEQNFVLHWMNNKEMHFSAEAEALLLEVSKRALDRDCASVDLDQTSAATDPVSVSGSRPHGSARSTPMRGKSLEEDETQGPSAGPTKSQQGHPMSAATSSNSIATDMTATTSAPLGDALDRRIEALLRDWFASADVLFSIHPVDGSLLMWVLDHLDGSPGTFRQAQVSFSARIPSALPLGDAMTMAPKLAVYNGTTPFFLRTLLKLEILALDEERNKTKSKSNLTLSSNEDMENLFAITSSPPIVCLTTKHSNGSLNLWYVAVAEDSRFTQVMNISHGTRVCGHRFQLNDIKCHPVLPLLLTTSHHNKQYSSPGNPPSTAASEDTPLICIQDSPSKDWCSEVILWRVDAVGPLSFSGGVTELSRINSPQVSAFSNAAWIPTLLPSTTLGKVSNSPSACFVASDGECLRVYQAVIDGRALLAEITTAERKKRSMEQTLSLSTDSSLQEHVGQKSLSEMFNVVSEQSTARPGCILQLDAVIDATHDWQNTQFLHVFQECLIRGERNAVASWNQAGAKGGLKSSVGFSTVDHSAMVDLHSKTGFEEPFYVALLEKTRNGPVMHMWRLVIASGQDESGVELLDGVGGEFISDEAQQGRTQNLPADASPVVISTFKMYCKPLPLPNGVEVVHSCPAAGHLSSASIYPACFAPYLMVTACSDNVVRFWRCRMVGEGDNPEIEWLEWSMISKERTSAITVPGEIFNVNAAYSGRVAVAHRGKSSESSLTSTSNALVFSSLVSIYECESTGGSEWVLSDTIELRDVIVNQGGYLGQELDLTFLSQGSDERPIRKLASALSCDDAVAEFSSDYSVVSVNQTASGQVQVPSLSTIKSLRSNHHENLEVDLKQTHPVQLSWLSMEDGSHLLTVAIGSKILVYTCVSEDVQQQSLKLGSVPAEIRSKSTLQKSPSLHQISLEVLPRWMRLEKFSLRTADGLAPLPMQIAWVRDGILVIGMDNEIQVCTQWNWNDSDSVDGATSYEVKNRDLTQVRLKSFLQDASTHHTKSVASMSRITSYSVLSSLDDKMKKGLGDVIENPVVEEIDDLSNSGIFEMSHMVSPVRPQYDPSQLKELLNSGKIRRVKAILAHLLRCLMVLSQNSADAINRTSFSDGEQDNKKSWSRTRTLSVSAAAVSSGGGGREGRNSLSLRPEELTLDYIKINAIPPLPLWLLLEADKDAQSSQRIVQDKKQDAYAELFGSVSVSTDVWDLDLNDDDVELNARRRSLTQEKRSIAFFGPRQAQCLAGLLTHTHLPGLSSLDQMHLLALADTVASCNVDFADKFDINKAKEAMAKETYGRSTADEPSMDSLDDCGLRFLLAMRHHTYLLRCLPIGQRPQLQKDGIGNHNIVWAFHSESQEELLDFIPAVRQGNIRWTELRELGVGWWVRSNSILSKIMLKVAKAAFQGRKDPLDAAIYYLAMQKKSLLWGLFRSVNDARMTDFFRNNFTEERWRKAALKNAFALMGKQRFAHAAAFFLLAGALKDAVEVVLTKLNDEQLAFIIARLYEGDLNATPPTLQKLLHVRILGCDEDGRNQSLSKIHPDPFLRSMAFWVLKIYNNSLKTLLMSDPEAATQHPEYNKDLKRHTKDISADPSVFNFYIYLRTHPLLIRHCIANSAKDTSGTLMASRFGAGHDSMDKKALYESSMTPQERCLYFKTASAHLCSGCPALALEVLSNLPNNVIDLDNPDSGDLLGSPVKEKRHGLDLIKSGTFEDTPPFKLSSQKAVSDEFGATSAGSETGFDWSSSASFQRSKENKVELDLDFSIKEDLTEDISDEDEPRSRSGSDSGSGGGGYKRLDIMAQQLKFICCLQMMMEELATLATGCEVDGGQLRYQLYVWLEREVEALKEICNYRNDLPTSGSDLIVVSEEEDEVIGSASPVPPVAGEQAATLHEILQQENIDFEYKRKRAVTRKCWLWANRNLLRTFLSYCSLHGSSGGGLASVRMELILLLQELQQENNKQQLLSPLPLPTTLPLLSAYVANNKTVVVDPVRHLQSQTHDLLQSLAKVGSIASPDIVLMRLSLTLRNLAAALSACIYQSLCDSENISVKAQPRVAALGLDLQHVSVAHRDSNLIGKEMKTCLPEGERLPICTAPSKWPGVPSLLALVTHERDEDLPRLNVLLCEAFVAVYMCLFVHGIASSDAYVLYRLSSVQVKEKDWGVLFGGGIRRVVKIITGPSVAAVTSSSEKVESSPSVSGERILSTITNLQKTRIKLNMKFLGQLGFQDPRSMPAEGDTKTGVREQFCPPELSLVSYLMSKPSLPTDMEGVDYDSCESDADDEEMDYEEDEDVFNEPKSFPENTEHSNTDSYSWCLLRLACLRRAQNVVTQFLVAAGIDLQELVVLSPLLHSSMRSLGHWGTSLVAHLEEKKGPPPEFIPGCFAQSNVTGPAFLKYKALLETHNTPFARNKRGVKPVNRLWHYLMRQEQVQPVFIRYIFGRKRPTPPVAAAVVHPSDQGAEDGGSDSAEIGGPENDGFSESGFEAQQELSEGAGAGGSDITSPSLEPVRIIHKDQDSVTAFCMNKVNNNLVAIATVKEVQELDISLLLKHPSWLIDECELDVLALNKDPDSIASSSFLVVQTPYDKTFLESKGAIDSGHSMMHSGSPISQSGRGSNVVLSYKIENSKRMTSHPGMPLYLVGCQDGSVVVREWRHSQVVSQPRPGGTFAKVTRVSFNEQGNKFSLIDGDGHLSLYHLGIAPQNNKPFYTHHCHNKHGNDFTFVGSSSLLATAGQSSEHRNVALWDTLMPQRKANVVSWTCHESGASSIIYAPQHQVLISAGKKGQVCIFDVRQRTFRHKFQAHDSSIKCMALDINEDFFVTGSADGDIKVWGLSVHNLVYNLPGEHSRTSLFKNLSQGVTNLFLDSSSRLFSCGADGSVKMRCLPERDFNINFL